VILPSHSVDELFAAVRGAPGFRLRIDLRDQTVTSPDGLHFSFEIDAFHKNSLIRNLDDIAMAGAVAYLKARRRYVQSSQTASRLPAVERRTLWRALKAWSKSGGKAISLAICGMSASLTYHSLSEVCSRDIG
jgi:hypothetical protein